MHKLTIEPTRIHVDRTLFAQLIYKYIYYTFLFLLQRLFALLLLGTSNFYWKQKHIEHEKGLKKSFAKSLLITLKLYGNHWMKNVYINCFNTPIHSICYVVIETPKESFASIPSYPTIYQWQSWMYYVLVLGRLKGS